MGVTIVISVIQQEHNEAAASGKRRAEALFYTAIQNFTHPQEARPAQKKLCLSLD
jgi:hypothetical protein